MSTNATIPGTDEAWDEGALGKEESFVKRVTLTNDQERQLDEALELQLISIRLHKSLIEDLKVIAKLNGMGYQPLIRQMLRRFVDSEFKKIVMEQVQAVEEEKERIRVEVGLGPKPKRRIA